MPRYAMLSITMSEQEAADRGVIALRYWNLQMICYD
jgi:hypothetical protein